MADEDRTPDVAVVGEHLTVPELEAALAEFIVENGKLAAERAEAERNVRMLIADIEALRANRDHLMFRYRAALRRIEGYRHSAMDTGSPVETLQGIARAALVRTGEENP